MRKGGYNLKHKLADYSQVTYFIPGLKFIYTDYLFLYTECTTIESEMTRRNKTPPIWLEGSFST